MQKKRERSKRTYQNMIDSIDRSISMVTTRYVDDDCATKMGDNGEEKILSEAEKGGAKKSEKLIEIL